MLKKIIYIIMALVLGFLMFYMSWEEAKSSARTRLMKKAIEENDFDFVCKFYAYYYEKEALFEQTYTENNNTTTIRAYNCFAEYKTTDENDKTVKKQGSYILLVITNINKEIIHIDESLIEEVESDDDLATRLTLTSNVDTNTTVVMPTYGYDEINVVCVPIIASETTNLLFNKKTDQTPTKITHITITDSSKEKEKMFDMDVDLSIVPKDDVAVWEAELEAGTVGKTLENANIINFPIPEMYKAFIITAVVLLIEIGLGLFIFWPKKSHVPTEEVDRETYTFASTEEKEKIAIAKVARSKKEKEDRENRYKNVRKETNLEDLSDKAIEESMDKENTAEAALEQDALEEKANEEATSTNEEIKETKEEE